MKPLVALLLLCAPLYPQTVRYNPFTRQYDYFGASSQFSHRKNFIGATAVSVLASEHKLGTANLLVACSDVSGSTVEPDTVIVATSEPRDVTIKFAVPQDGDCLIYTAQNSHSASFTNQTTVTVQAHVHRLRSITGVACYDNSGQLFETGDATFSRTAFGNSGVMATTYIISISLVAPQSGRCVSLGV